MSPVLNGILRVSLCCPRTYEWSSATVAPRRSLSKSPPRSEQCPFEFAVALAEVASKFSAEQCFDFAIASAARALIAVGRARFGNGSEGGAAGEGWTRRTGGVGSAVVARWVLPPRFRYQGSDTELWSVEVEERA